MSISSSPARVVIRTGSVVTCRLPLGGWPSGQTTGRPFDGARAAARRHRPCVLRDGPALSHQNRSSGPRLATGRYHDDDRAMNATASVLVMVHIGLVEEPWLSPLRARRAGEKKPAASCRRLWARTLADLSGRRANYQRPSGHAPCGEELARPRREAC
jgi:hypothetical protein